MKAAASETVRFSGGLNPRSDLARTALSRFISRSLLIIDRIFGSTHISALPYPFLKFRGVILEVG